MITACLRCHVTQSDAGVLQEYAVHHGVTVLGLPETIGIEIFDQDVRVGGCDVLSVFYSSGNIDYVSAGRTISLDLLKISTMGRRV